PARCGSSTAAGAPANGPRYPGPGLLSWGYPRGRWVTGGAGHPGTLSDFDAPLLGYGFWDLGCLDGEDTIVKSGADILFVDVAPQVEAAAELAVAALLADHPPFLLFLALLAGFGIDGENAFLQGDVQVLLLHAGQFGSDLVVVVQLLDIHPGGEEGADVVAAAPGGRPEIVEEPVHVKETASGYQCHGVPPRKLPGFERVRLQTLAAPGGGRRRASPVQLQRYERNRLFQGVGAA